MAVATRPSGGYLERPRPSGLADVLEIILDKGIVIASVDTYLRFAEAVGRLNLQQADDSQGLPDLMESVTSGGAKSKTKGAIEGVKEKVFGDDDQEDQPKGRARSASSRSSGSASRSRSSRSGSGGSSS